MRNSSTLLVPLLLAVMLAGCGEPRQVTYVDPNGADQPGQAGDGGEPFIRYGAAVTERARACIAVRSGLTVARTLAVTDDRDASEVLDRTLADHLPTLEPRGHAAVPGAVRQLRDGIEQLRDAPPRNVADYNVQVQRLSDGLLARTCDVVVPQAARQDSSFRAAMLHETLQDAATSYEESFDGGSSKIQLPESYQRAYGLLVDASTRQLEAVPEDARPSIRARLDKITRRATTGPVPPARPYDPELIVGDLSALADDVVTAARIDTTMPGPDADSPDRLRSLKRALASAVEASERGARSAALEQLRSADRSWLVPASSSIASVSPSLLTELERDVLVVLPDAIRDGDDVASLASDADMRLDEAISLVEEELEILREST